MTWNPSPPQKRCKVTIKREQYKIKCVLFLLSSVSNLLKVSAKNRLSEEKAKSFAFLSERFLFKPKTIQNKIRFIFIVEVQPNLLKVTLSLRYKRKKHNNFA